jgi:hypothetical protein
MEKKPVDEMSVLVALTAISVGVGNVMSISYGGNLTVSVIRSPRVLLTKTR